MLPLNKAYFSITDENKFYYFDSGVLKDMIGMCYVGAKGRVWREILGISFTDVTPSFLEALYRKYNPFWTWASIQGTKKGSQYWYTDQRYLTEKLLSSEAYRVNLYKPKERKKSSSKDWLVEDRVDRANWDFNPEQKEFYIDAHSPVNKPWDRSHPNWSVTLKLLDTFMPSKKRLIEEYVTEYADRVSTCF